MKRYLRLDMEYDFDPPLRLYMVADNIQRILSEDMPYVKVIFTRDTSDKDNLDNPKVRK